MQSDFSTDAEKNKVKIPPNVLPMQSRFEKLKLCNRFDSVLSVSDKIDSLGANNATLDVFLSIFTLDKAKTATLAKVKSFF